MPHPSRDKPLYPGEDGATRSGPSSVAIETLNVRWLLGIAIIVPVALTAGVVWLHRLPAGSQNSQTGPLVEVRLVREPRQEPAQLVMPTPEQGAAKGWSEPLVEAPKRPIPAEATVAPPTSAMIDPEPTPDRRPSSAPTKRPAVQSGAASAYQRLLLGHISRYLRYPKEGEGRQLHGVVHVRFAMRRDGTVTEAWVRTSSGHPLLDEAATETIRRAQPLPPIPSDLPDTLIVLLPVSFDGR